MMSNVQIEDILLLSPIQQSLLAEIVSRGRQETHVEQKAYRWQGELDLVLLNKSIETLTRRMPLLRASVHWQGLEKPLMTVQGELPGSLLRRQDWSDLPPA